MAWGSSRSMRSRRRITRSCRASSCSPQRAMSSRICWWTSRMGSSTPRSERPDIQRAPVVSAVVADRKRLPSLPRSAGPYRRAWWRLKRDKIGMTSALVLGAIGVLAYIVPALIAIDPYQQSLRDSLQAPGPAGHLLGTDNFGRDVLLRLIDGGRVSLSVGLLAVAISATVGGLIGLVAGYSGD